MEDRANKFSDPLCVAKLAVPCRQTWRSLHFFRACAAWLTDLKYGTHLTVWKTIYFVVATWPCCCVLALAEVFHGDEKVFIFSRGCATWLDDLKQVGFRWRYTVPQCRHVLSFLLHGWLISRSCRLWCSLFSLGIDSDAWLTQSTWSMVW
jgi:hypothetical protein